MMLPEISTAIVMVGSIMAGSPAEANHQLEMAAKQKIGGIFDGAQSHTQASHH